MTTAWVTGANGFIGRHLCRRLARQGWEVCGTDLLAFADGEAEGWGIARWATGDLDDVRLDGLLRHGEPDAVFHLAGGSSVGASLADPLTDFRRTTGLTAALLDWMRRHTPRARIVLASSAAVYGAGHLAPIPVSTAVKPYSPYGHHKRMAELLCESYASSFGLRASVVRLFSVYGAGLRKQLLWDLCCKLKAGPSRLELGGTGDEVRDWLHVEGAADFLIHAASVPTPFQKQNGGTGVPTSVREVVRLVTDAWRSSAEVIFTGVARAGDPEYLVADPSCTAEVYPLHAVGLAQGIREYVDWFRESGAASGA
jgi:UDP-glucose 4-epimerase